ncbi:hypothetical protein LINPERHAP1_LOCUS8052 [Linum perenne]
MGKLFLDPSHQTNGLMMNLMKIHEYKNQPT